MAATLGVHGHSHGGQSEERHGHSHGEKAEGKSAADNINVRAAYIHVLGDMVQSIVCVAWKWAMAWSIANRYVPLQGVMVAAALIWWKPTWHILDPICTMLFAVLVLLTTFSLLKVCRHDGPSMRLRNKHGRGVGMGRRRCMF